AVSEGRRREFARFGVDAKDVPDPQALETFQRSKLDWAELAREPHASMLEWYRRLIRLRRDHPELRDGRLDQLRVSFEENVRWLLAARGPFSIPGNLSAAARAVSLAPDRPRTVLPASDERVRVTADAIELPRESVVIVGPPSP